jgi:autotransporter-associated beta strand protein
VQWFALKIFLNFFKNSIPEVKRMSRHFVWTGRSPMQLPTPPTPQLGLFMMFSALRRLTQGLCPLVSILAVVGYAPAHAQTKYWIQPSLSGDFASGYNWGLSPSGPAAGYSATDQLRISASRPTVPGVFQQYSYLNAGGLGSESHLALLLNQNGYPLQLNGPAPTLSSTGGEFTVTNGSIFLPNGATTTLDAQGSANLNLSSGLFGTTSANVIKTGSGTARLLAPNSTFGGSVVVSQGTLEIGTLANVGVLSSLGTGNNLSLQNGSQLRYGGPITSTNRMLSLSGGTNRVSVENGSSVTWNGPIMGIGGLQKEGNGTLALGGATSYSGPTNINLGELRIVGGSGIADSSTVDIAGPGLYNLNGFNDVIGSLSGASGSHVALGGGSLTAGGNSNSTTFNGVISGTGSFTKSGYGTLALGGSNLLTGPVYIQAGGLSLRTNNALQYANSITIDSGAVLQILNTNQQTNSIFNAGFASVVNSTTNVTGQMWNNGTTTIADSQLSGPLMQNHGIVNVNLAASIQTSLLENKLGGTINLNTPTSLLGSTNIVNDGTIVGDFQINLGQSLSGFGTVSGELTVSNGGILKPGLSIGTMTIDDVIFGSAGIFDWELDDAIGVAGSEWDLLSVTQALSITATSATPFEINLLASGPIDNFDDTQNYAWTIASVAGGISGFAPDKFVLDTSAIPNPFSGTFSVAASGNDLQILYTVAIPEPSSATCLALCCAVSLTIRRRR